MAVRFEVGEILEVFEEFDQTPKLVDRKLDGVASSASINKILCMELYHGLFLSPTKDTTP